MLVWTIASSLCASRKGLVYSGYKVDYFTDATYGEKVCMANKQKH